MDLRKLRHAVMLARFLNFTKAAEALNLTQSALTRSIQALESECQVRLFDRTRNMVAVTAVGREFLRSAETMLRNEAELSNMLMHAANGDGGRIALGMAPLAARTLLAPLMSEMIGKPGFHANITTGSPKRLLALLVDEALEICVCTAHTAPANAPYSGILLAHFPLGIVVRKNHPIAHLDKVTPEDLEPFPLLRTRSTELDDNATSTLHLGPRKQPALTVEDYDILMRVAAHSDAVWITSPVSAREGLENGTLTHIPISWLEQDVEIPMTAYFLKHRTLSPLAQSILDRMIVLCGEMDHVRASARS